MTRIRRPSARTFAIYLALIVAFAALGLAIFDLVTAGSDSASSTPGPTSPAPRSEPSLLSEVTDLLSVLAWPLFALTIVLILISKPGRTAVSQALGRVQRVSGLGLNLEFTAERAQEVRRTLEATFADYRAREIDEFDRLVRERSLTRLCDRIATDCIEPRLISEAQPDFRCTIYVQDLIFEEGLYQLLDYFPKGGGRGRIIGRRFGIVGRAFRAEESKIDSDVPSTKEELIVHWGMTAEEAARAGRDRRSFACILLTDHSGAPVAGIYVDANPPLAFGLDEEAETEFIEAVRAFANSSGLTTAMAAVALDIRRRGPEIRLLYRPPNA